MENLASILIVTSDEQSELVEIMFNLGYLPLIRRKMYPALNMIRHKCVDAVFLDFDQMEIDALEFIINVRDLNSVIPVVIVDTPIDEKEFLLKQNYVVLIEKDVNQIKTFLKSLLRTTS